MNHETAAAVVSPMIGVDNCHPDELAGILIAEHHSAAKSRTQFGQATATNLKGTSCDIAFLGNGRPFPRAAGNGAHSAAGRPRGNLRMANRCSESAGPSDRPSHRCRSRKPPVGSSPDDGRRTVSHLVIARDAADGITSPHTA